MSRRKRSCTGKQRHADRHAAEDQLHSLKHNRFASLTYMTVYKCRHCGGWHVGHKIGSGGRRR